MSFDADAYLEALQPPEITVGGKHYMGRFLSIEDWAPFEPRLAKFKEAQELLDMQKLDPKAIQAHANTVKQVIRDFCNAAFPSPWYQLFNPWYRTVAEQVLALPPAAMMKAAVDFFESQARALDVNRALENE